MKFKFTLSVIDEKLRYLIEIKIYLRIHTNK